MPNSKTSGTIFSSTLNSGTVTDTAWNSSFQFAKGITMPAEADLMIGTRSLKHFMETVSDRLLILTPDSAKLEKHEALKKAYDHYRLMEKLLGED